jgi:predicted outer membrane protein
VKIAISVSIVLVTATVCFLVTVHALHKEAGSAAQGAIATAQSAIEMVKQLLNVTPQVTITTSVTRQKTTDILELASVSKEFPVDYHYENKQLGSTKRLDLRGQYVVKAGFDLRERFSVQVDETSHRVSADFPAPKILSVEQTKYQVIGDDNGWWNRLTQKDQEEAVNDMNAQARKTALEMQVCEEAKASLRRQLQALAKKMGQEWDITFRDEPPFVAEPGDRKL